LKRIVVVMLAVVLVFVAGCRSTATGGSPNVEDVARRAGMPPISTTALPEGEEEVRLWVWTGILLPNQMVRLTHARGRWMGELWRYWPSDNQPFTDVMERCGCARMIRGSDYTACRVLEEKGIDWEAFARGLQELKALGPNPEPPTIGRGGDALDIEVRTGGAYRRSHTEGGEVVRMIKALDTQRCR
jgi:hypothetical protein